MSVPPKKNTLLLSFLTEQGAVLSDFSTIRVTDSQN
jgi:hypothetical protein